jgi:hypothetical protein
VHYHTWLFGLFSSSKNSSLQNWVENLFLMEKVLLDVVLHTCNASYVVMREMEIGRS